MTFHNSTCAFSIVTMITLIYILASHGVNLFCDIIDHSCHTFNDFFKEYNSVNKFGSAILQVVTNCVMLVLTALSGADLFHVMFSSFVTKVTEITLKIFTDLLHF